ncbi:MAG: hypothetical protein NTZ59_02615 [Bacteroidetes bacterium]|jgi:hypothetical protein|nr:hypothetical protein [Bacteroidota bacterium]
MEHNHHHTGVIKNYTGTAILSFCIIFFLFALMSKCSGPYHPVGAHHSNAAHQEHKADAHHEESKAPAEHH